MTKRARVVSWVLWAVFALALASCQGGTTAAAEPNPWEATMAAQATRVAQQAATVEAQSAALATLQTAATATPTRPSVSTATPTRPSAPTATVPRPTATPSRDARAEDATTAARDVSTTAGASAAAARQRQSNRVHLTVPVDTLCRVGPGLAFYRLGVVRAGEPVRVIGRWDVYWRVQLDDGTKCWIWGEHAILDQDAAAVPRVVPGVGAIWGHVFTDVNRDGLYQPGVDGRKGGTRVELYPATNGACDWTAAPLAQTKVNGKSAYTFVFNLRKPTAYCVKAIFTHPGETVCRAQRVVVAKPGQPAQGDLYTIPCTGPGCVCP